MGNLVLRRRAGESLVLFDDAGVEMGRVTVAAVGTERVKLALAFRGDVTIMREELVAQDRAETATDATGNARTVTAAAWCDTRRETLR